MKDIPHISLIIPFEPAMAHPRTLLKIMSAAAEKNEIDLLKKYSEEEAMPLINVLREVIQDIKCSPNEKTLAIMISPFGRKIYYFIPTKNNHLPRMGVDTSK
jgi:hypothetical protein